jgi:hypothetical protein
MTLIESVARARELLEATDLTTDELAVLDALGSARNKTGGDYSLVVKPEDTSKAQKAAEGLARRGLAVTSWTKGGRGKALRVDMPPRVWSPDDLEKKAGAERPEVKVAGKAKRWRWVTWEEWAMPTTWSSTKDLNWRK